jgi:NodT family efflux transporter outer membrane factor (OMF) lipoprotein
MKNIFSPKLILSSSLIILLCNCSLAPEYHPPATAIPTHYQEAGHWLPAQPQQANLSRGAWWEMYQDAELNKLEQTLEDANQNLKAALARYESARAAVAIARAGYFPTAVVIGNGSRQQSSVNVANANSTPLYNDALLGVDIHYEVDVWGRVRNTVTSATSQAKASAADVASINLSLQAALANAYFSLRAADSELRILHDTVIAYQKALALTRHRYRGGAAPIVDVDQAEAQLQNAKTALADMRLKRQQLAHAIAVLIGAAPVNFSLAAAPTKMQLVTIAPHLPSTLLERRPDIAAAALRVQAANAEIGVARAAFFPDFNLAAGIGVESQTLSNLISSPSRIWSLGPSSSLTSLDATRNPLVSYTLFDGGRIRAQSEQAWAVYNMQVANYRQTVLNALQEVEDNLVALHQLDREIHTQQAATSAAQRALVQAMYRYKGGLTTYLDVVVAQNIANQAELALVDVRNRRQLASVGLIKALGGGWDSDSCRGQACVGA